MRAAHTRCVALTGIDGHMVEIHAKTSHGLPGLTLASMAEPGMWETRDRVRAAVVNSGENWPDQRLTIIVPAVPGGGPHYDLPIAVAVLAAGWQRAHSAARGRAARRAWPGWAAAPGPWGADRGAGGCGCGLR